MLAPMEGIHLTTHPTKGFPLLILVSRWTSICVCTRVCIAVRPVVTPCGGSGVYVYAMVNRLQTASESCGVQSVTAPVSILFS